MSRGCYRYALICLLVGCIPPPAGGYPSYPQRPYQEPGPQKYGYDYDGDYDNGDYGNGNDGNGDYGNNDYGNTDDGRGGARTPTRTSGGWSCSAEASFGTAIGEGPMSYSVKSGYGTASTRGEAENLALKHCGQIVNVSILIADDMRHEIGECGIASCTNLGR